MTGRRIRIRRRALGLTQAELARRVGTHQPTVSAWENGRELPSRPILLRLARELGESVAFLLGSDHMEGDLESLLLLILDRLPPKSIETLAGADPRTLRLWLAGLEAMDAADRPPKRPGPVDTRKSCS